MTTRKHFRVVAIDNQMQIITVLSTDIWMGLGADRARRAFKKNPEYYDVLVIDSSVNDSLVLDESMVTCIKYSAYYNHYYVLGAGVYPFHRLSDLDLNSSSGSTPTASLFSRCLNWLIR